MNGPILWIAAPFVLGALLWLVPRERLVAWLGTLVAAILTILALLVPTDTALNVFGYFSLRVDSTLVLLGRQVSLSPSTQVVLVLAYAIGTFWFFGSLAAGTARRVVPLGLMIIAMLVASLAIRPFLYAALLIEGAVLLSVFLLAEPGQTSRRGLTRFLIYQTLAMPFILFAGFLLSGVDAGPGDLAVILQAAILLGLGFAFLLSIFPLSTWMPMLAEEGSPYAVGFVLAVFPLFALLFGLNFVERYAWIRESDEFFATLQFIGLLTALSGGVSAAFQRQAGRIFGYAAVTELGLALAAVSLPDRLLGLQLVFAMIAPRALAYGTWAISLFILRQAAPDLRYSSLQGLARRYPLAALGWFFALLSLSGVPLLAGFPARQALWQALAAGGFFPALAVGLATSGLWISGLRSLAVLAMSGEQESWQVNETPFQRVLLLTGMALMFILGLFPQWAAPLLVNLPGLFGQVTR